MRNEECWPKRRVLRAGLIRAGEAQPGSIGIGDEDAVLTELEFPGLPGGFAAVVGVPTGVIDPGYSDKVVVIGGNPL
jgi:hypothetical protein